MDSLLTSLVFNFLSEAVSSLLLSLTQCHCDQLVAESASDEHTYLKHCDFSLAEVSNLIVAVGVDSLHASPELATIEERAPCHVWRSVRDGGGEDRQTQLQIQTEIFRADSHRAALV